MKETEFLILTHAGMYVDERQLHRGIYVTNLPILHSIDNTIEQMISQVKEFDEKIKVGWEKQYIENLNLYKLVKVKLTEI